MLHLRSNRTATLSSSHRDSGHELLPLEWEVHVRGEEILMETLFAALLDSDLLKMHQAHAVLLQSSYT
jgi:hypothetical protein